MKPFSIDVPTLHAGHVTLRPVRLSDAAAIDQGASHYDVSKMTTSIPHPVVDGDTEGFLNQVIGPDRREMVWAIVWTGEEEGDLLGLISLENDARADAEIGYWVAPHFWGRGVASAAADSVIRWNPLNCNTIFGSCFADNPASARVMLKAGFVETGKGQTFSQARQAKVETREFLWSLADHGRVD